MTEDEMCSLHALGDTGPRVITHDYGAWVWVPSVPLDEFYPAFRGHYPNVAACIDQARALDCNWINFDQDADHHTGLPVYDW